MASSTCGLGFFNTLWSILLKNLNLKKFSVQDFKIRISLGKLSCSKVHRVWSLIIYKIILPLSSTYGILVKGYMSYGWVNSMNFWLTKFMMETCYLGDYYYFHILLINFQSLHTKCLKLWIFNTKWKCKLVHMYVYPSKHNFL